MWSMQVELEMPKLGESIAEATILSWYKKEGEYIEEGTTLLDIATDKVDSEVEAPCSGVVEKIYFQANDVVPVGAVLAVINTAASGAQASDAVESVIEEEVAALAKQPAKAISRENGMPATANGVEKPVQSPQTARGQIFLSPLVRSIAKEEGISEADIAQINGSGYQGRIRKSDVIKYLKQRPATQPAPVAAGAASIAAFKPPSAKIEDGRDRVVEMTRMREMIAGHMSYSVQTSPHVTSYVEVDMTEIVNWRNKAKQRLLEKYGYKLTFTPFFLQAVAKALRDYPMVNAFLQGKNIIVKKDVNIGMATALPSGDLIVPVIRNADELNLVGLAKEVNRLAEKARKSQLQPSDVEGGTFTLSNVGTFGSLAGTPIINQPQSAILATGIIKKRVEVMERPEGDKMEIRQMMIMSLSFDHRIIDGFLGGSFAKQVANYLEGFHPDTTI